MRLDSTGSIKAEAIWKEADRMLEREDITMIACPTWHFATSAKVAADRDIISELRYMGAKKRTAPQQKAHREDREFFKQLEE